MKILKNKKLMICLMSMLLAVCLIMPSFTASAELVDVYTIEDPEFEFLNIYDASGSTGYKPSPANGIISQENGVYKMQSNAWSTWYTHCNVAYAYKQADFNTGDGSILTVKTTMDTYDGKEAALVIRESLNADSVLAHVSMRVDGLYFIWRPTTGANCEYKMIAKSIIYGTDAVPNPIHLKLTLDKTKGRVFAEYKIGGDIDSDDGWSSVHTMTLRNLTSLDKVYTGISSATSNENFMSKLQWSNYSINLKAPEGYTTGGGTGDDTSKPPEITLPDDDAATGDTLLRETFTDGDLFPSEESVTNPLWTVRSGEPTVKVDDQKLNRYLSIEAGTDPLMMTAGDMSETDYSVQMEFSFTEDALKDEANHIELLFRHRSVVIGGSADYSVVIINNIANNSFVSQEIQLRYRPSSSTFIPGGNQIILDRKVLSTSEMLAANEIHTIKVNVIDNKITVYFDDMSTPVFDFTDDNSKHKGNDANLKGCIGIVAKYTAAKIDNIVVRDLTDALGGDWDNEIQGSYDEPIPDWLSDRYDKE